MKATPKKQAIAVLIYEYSHAKACEASNRAKATNATGVDRDVYMATADFWQAAAALTAKTLRDNGYPVL